MKFKSPQLFTTVIFLFMVNFANAALVKTTADFSITKIAGSFATVSVNDVFKFSAIYDDEGTSLSNGDGTSRCLGIVSDVNCSRISSPFIYKFMSDALFNINELFDVAALSDAGGALYDTSSYPSISHLKLNQLIGKYNFKLAGGAIVASWDSQKGGMLEEDYTRMFYKDDLGIQRSTLIVFKGGLLTTVPVINASTPATLGLFALGMLGMAARRFKK